MRVTKLIREYVVKAVTSKMPFGEPRSAYIQHQRALADLTDQLNDKVSQYADELLASVANLPEGFKITKNGLRVFTNSTYGSPMRIAAEKHESEIRARREEAIENILLELELGATKADLERLIAEAVGK